MGNEEVMAKMDKAAEEAAGQLSNMPAEHVATVANWWRANYMSAGHKRLGRVLAGKSKSDDIASLAKLVATS